MKGFPEKFKVVKLYHGAANAVACDYISCKDVVGNVTFLIYHDDAGNDTDLTVGLIEATDVAAGTSAAVTATFPIYVDVDCGTSSDVVVRQTDAASYVINTGTTPGNDHLVMIEWDPAYHTDGYDCISVSDSGGNASNTVTVLAIYEAGYQGASLRAAITD